MRGSSFFSALGLLASASGLLMISACSDSEARHFIGVDDGAYLRGQHLVAIDVTDQLGTRRAVRAELYIDGQRIATDELAPFELSWNTRDFTDGEYELQARVILDDDGRLDDALAIHIDNTAPTLGDLPGLLARNQAVDIPADDNFDVARVEISRGVAGESPTVLMSRPFVFRWPWACVAVALRVRVTDRAGGETERSFDVKSLENLNDQDCDEHLSFAGGGQDCNDADPWIHDGALEYSDGVDRNCDGFRGPSQLVDADGDGVASYASGGDDCDDANPAVHGKALVLAHRDLFINGTPLTWNPGEAVLGGEGSAWELFLNRGGVLVNVRPESGQLVVEEVATGINRAAVHSVASFVSFGRGTQVVTMVRGSGWTTHNVLPASAPVGAVAFVPAFNGVEYTAFQAGTQVFFVSRRALGEYTMEPIVDVGAPLVGGIVLFAAPIGATMVFRTATTVWKAVRTGTTGSFSVGMVVPPRAQGLAAFAASSDNVYLAADHGTGSALYDDKSSTPLQRFPRRITSLYARYPYIYVHLDGLGTQVLSIPQRYRRVQIMPETRPFDASQVLGNAFAGSGYVEHATQATSFPPPDPSGDSLDRNCDGSED